MYRSCPENEIKILNNYFVYLFRILAKYYDGGKIFSNTQAQKKFEKNLFSKTHKVRIV